MNCSIVQADAIAFLNGLPADSVDLVFGSPPYELARLYLEDGESTGAARPTEEWVAWMVKVFEASVRICRGLVAFVVEGQTKNYRYSCGPVLLMADLHRAGFNLRRPCFYHRVGIPGSGGPDWLRGDTEFVVCVTRPGRLPWSDNTATGHEPLWQVGGEMSNRQVNGERINGRKGKIRTNRLAKGELSPQCYVPPDVANPGNVIHCDVGGGRIGSALAHENEAPFPEDLAEFFVRSFCPPGGLVCDPFSGSGTTAAISVRHARNFTGCDLRQSQVDLGLRRVGGESTNLFSSMDGEPSRNSE